MDLLPAILLLAGIATCAVAYFDVLTGRYERARERAPRPLRVSEIGEPPHGSPSRPGGRATS